MLGGVTAGQARHNSSNVGCVTAGQVGHNSSYNNVRNEVNEFRLTLDRVLKQLRIFQLLN